MSLASAQLPDLHLRGKCCNFSSCGDCFNPGDRITLQPPKGDSNQPSVNVSTTTCCLFCISNRGNSEENKVTWQLFQQYLELCYGKQAAEIALSSKSIDSKSNNHTSGPLRARDYQELKEIAEFAHSYRDNIDYIFKLAKLKAYFDIQEPAKIREEISFNEGKLQRINSIHVETLDSLIGKEPFDIDKLKDNLKKIPLDKSLEDQDIERITLMVLDDILEAGVQVLTKDEIRAKLFKYIKALGINVKPPEFYERIAPLALKTLHKKDASALSPEEYEAYLQLASTLMFSKPITDSKANHPKQAQVSAAASMASFPVTLTSARNSEILGHIQFEGPKIALEQIAREINQSISDVSSAKIEPKSKEVLGEEVQLKNVDLKVSESLGSLQAPSNQQKH
jgi:hypothetical protein